MKRNEFITKMLVGIPLLLIPRKPVAAAPVTICIYVKIDIGGVTIKFVACFTITVGGSNAVIVNIRDTRLPGSPIVQRPALDINGNPIFAPTATTLNAPSTVTLP